MLNIDEIKDEIVSALMPLKPDKIILFGSYARGEANENSDLDLFLIKKGLKDFTKYEIEARKRLRNIILNYDTNDRYFICISKLFKKKR